MFHRVVTGSDAGGKLHEIDSPWGMELAPSTLERVLKMQFMTLWLGALA
jgi:hypothetical protein